MDNIGKDFCLGQFEFQAEFEVLGTAKHTSSGERHDYNATAYQQNSESDHQKECGC